MFPVVKTDRVQSGWRQALGNHHRPFLSSSQPFRREYLGTIEPKLHGVVCLNVESIVVCNGRPNHASPSHSEMIRWKTVHWGVQVPIHVQLRVNTMPHCPIISPQRIWEILTLQATLCGQFEVCRVSPTLRSQKARGVATVAVVHYHTLDRVAATIQTLRGHGLCGH